MIPFLISLPVFSLLAVLQSSLFNRITLLHGKADLILLFIMGWAIQKRVQTHWHWAVIGGLMASPLSALPFGIFPVAYLVSAAITIFMKRRIWKAPLLAMLASVLLGTIIVHFFTYLVLIFRIGLLPLGDVLNFILLPSMLLNFLLAFPVYWIVKEIADWLYPEQIKV